MKHARHSDHQDHSRRAPARCTVAALLSLAFAATAAPLPAHAADKIVVAAIVPTGGANVVLVGKDKGFFAAEGIDLQVLPISAGTGLPPTVASGDADVAVSSLSAGFFNVAGNGDFALIGGATYAKPGYTQAIIMANIDAYNKGFHSAADLPGKKIAFSSLGGLAHYYLYLLSEKYHFPFDSVMTPALGSDANALAAVKARAADGAMVGSGVLAVPLEQSGDGKIIVRTADEAPALSNVLFTSRKAIAAKRDTLVRFMRAYLKSAELYSRTFAMRDSGGNLTRNADINELLGILSRNIGQPVEGVIPTLTYALPDAALDPAEIEKQLGVWKKLGLSDAKVDATKLVDLSILQAAKAH